MGGGAWPFLVGGAICLVNSDNERDSSLLNRWRVLSLKFWVRSSSGPGSALLPGSPSGVFFSSFSSVGFSESVGGGGGEACWERAGSVASVPRRSAPFSRPSQLFLEGQAASSRVTVSNNRSVMPLDVLGRTRATLN